MAHRPCHFQGDCLATNRLVHTLGHWVAQDTLGSLRRPLGPTLSWGHWCCSCYCMQPPRSLLGQRQCRHTQWTRCLQEKRAKCSYSELRIGSLSYTAAISETTHTLYTYMLSVGVSMSVLSLTSIVCAFLLIVVLGPTPGLSSGVTLFTNLPWGNIEALWAVQGLTQRHIVSQNSNILQKDENKWKMTENVQVRTKNCLPSRVWGASRGNSLSLLGTRSHAYSHWGSDVCTWLSCHGDSGQLWRDLCVEMHEAVHLKSAVYSVIVIKQVIVSISDQDTSLVRTTPMNTASAQQAFDKWYE